MTRMDNGRRKAAPAGDVARLYRLGLTVAYARERSTPVWVIWPDGAQRG